MAALTQPVWEDGIPPDPIRRVQSQRRSLYQNVKAFSVCAITNAITAAMNGLRGKPRLSRWAGRKAGKHTTLDV